ncbi:hypothetical protein VTO42DRAFT_7587 [Malbranchea cinnamomea]
MPLTTQTEALATPVLYVEARVKNTKDNVIIRTDLVREEVTRWLIDNFAVLSLGQEISSFDDLNSPHAQYLETVRVIECTGTGSHVGSDSGAYRLADVQLDVQAYQLRFLDASAESTQQTEQGNSDNDAPQARILPLPSQELDGLWESLLFEDPIPANLLRAVSRMLAFSWRKLNVWAINWNRLVLLYGPPGTGKTSLCRALVQKLAIRLGRLFPQSKLVEINAHSLGSKFFSESGKLVSRMFNSIEAMLEEEQDTLVCILVDEVETLTAQREKVLSGSDPFDAMRAVNSLLTALDRLRHRPNVVVLCTSNLITALDSAFLDRVDIKQFVPHPSPSVIYEIYKSCLEDLCRCGLIAGSSFDVIGVEPDNPETPLKYVCQPAEYLALPSYGETLLSYQLFPESVPKQLYDVAQASIGLSGRTLRRLPALSLVLHTGSSTCTIEEALAALRKGLDEELRVRSEAGCHERMVEK